MKTIGYIILVIILTVLTQIGGVVLILAILLFRVLFQKTTRIRRKMFKGLTVVGLYILSTFVIVPLIAKPYGRVPMPIFSNTHVKPLNIFTCVFNRHYVKPELLSSIESSAIQISEKHPGTVVSYLDANFPFIDRFPLLPHLSHNDGEKIDIAFLYIDAKSNQPIDNEAPSFMGYGVYEKPAVGEINQPMDCANKGYWQYSFLQYLVPQWNNDKMTFDQERTKDLMTLFIQDKSIGKIFIEPHLKSRMQLNYDKIRFHGCQAVRHDDHIHVQL